jgi:hypothetical protein
MTLLLNWNNIVVPQRHESGCAPTGYEWLIRYIGIKGVKLDTFQEDFDLGRNNSFDSVAAEIRRKYHTINIQVQSFTKGIDKVGRIKTLIDGQTPCLFSLALGQEQGWHIMPIVYINNSVMEMIHHADEHGNYTWKFPIQTIIWRHDNLQGGNDISWIASSQNPKACHSQFETQYR